MSKIQLGVVRYVPDPVRDEPRNVGVVAWHAGKAVARFIGEDDVGALDRRRISSRLIPDRQTYGDWVQFWRSQLASGFVQDPVRQSKVAVASTDFLDALANVTRGGFEVRLGAETLVNKEWALDRVVQEAFDRLVHLEEWDDVVESEQAPKGKGHHRQLAYDACRALTKQRYRDKHDFVRDYEVFGRTAKNHKVPAVFDIGVLAPNDLITNSRLLLVDAVSLTASEKEASDVVDRARAVATKAQEMKKLEEEPLVRALISNGRSDQTDVARYAIHILEDDGGIETITIEKLIQLVPKVRQGQL